MPNGELNGRVTDLRIGSVPQGRHAAALTRRPSASSAPRRHRPHLQAVRALRADQRAPPGRQPAGDAGRARPRRAAAPHQLRDQRPALEAMIAAGIQTGFGDEWIKFGSTSEHTVDGSFSERTMALSTPYPGVDAALQGQRHRDAGHAERVGGARAPRRHPGELPRQRRRGHRHVSHRRSSAR